MKNRSLKRLHKKANKGMRGWPMATVAYYGPNLDRASKVVVGIIPFEGADVSEISDWKLDFGDVRKDARIAEEILDFIKAQGAVSVVAADGIIGCPHQEGIDYEGQWCPVCDFWKGRDRFTGKPLH